MRGLEAVRLRVLATLLLGVGGGLLTAGVARAAEAPLNGSPPSITGTAKDGQRLKASKGSWSNANACGSSLWL